MTEILKHPESARVTDASIPDQPALYGPASGLTLSVVTFLTCPTAPKRQKNSDAFPYHDARYGIFYAYLKHDPEALAALKTARSARGGNKDTQLFDYQRSYGRD